MKQSLQIKMGQQLAMTPQLQQAIKLLQLSTLELQTEIQSALENNPMLEMQEDEGADPKETDAANENNAENSERKRNEEKLKKEEIKEEVSAGSADDTIVEEHFEASLSEQPDAMPDELPVDSVWEDVYETATPVSSGSGTDGESRDFTEFHNSGISSIQDHLNDQIQFAPLSERDQVIAATLIDAVDDNGYLIDDVDTLLEGLNRDFTDPEDMFEMNELETVLHMVQHLDLSLIHI